MYSPSSVFTISSGAMTAPPVSEADTHITPARQQQLEACRQHARLARPHRPHRSMLAALELLHTGREDGYALPRPGHPADFSLAEGLAMMQQRGERFDYHLAVDQAAADFPGHAHHPLLHGVELLPPAWVHRHAPSPGLRAAHGDADAQTRRQQQEQFLDHHLFGAPNSSALLMCANGHALLVSRLHDGSHCALGIPEDLAPSASQHLRQMLQQPGSEEWALVIMRR